MGPTEANKAPIHTRMTVLDIVRAHPQTRAVFDRLGQQIKCCLLCDHLFESLEFLAGRYGLDRDTLLQEIQDAIEK